MQSLRLKAWLFVWIGSSGCQLLIDPHPDDMGGPQGPDAGSQDDNQPAPEGDGDADEDPVSAACAAVTCLTGTRCEVNEAGEATCVDDDATGLAGERCGNVTCDVGEVCCNASCGICTEPDGVCIDLWCEPTPGLTCASVLCIEGTNCVETPNGPVCVPNEENPCNLLDCPPNAICEVVMGEATCVPVPVEPSSCAAALCPVGTYCDDISGHVECIPLPSCDDVECDPETHCELQEVQCVRAPCPPRPACVPDGQGGSCPGSCAVLDCANCKDINGYAYCGWDPECDDPCARVRCGAGTTCKPQEVVCVTTPCCPVAECVPTRDAGPRCDRQ